jgi:hypothetical protein
VAAPCRLPSVTLRPRLRGSDAPRSCFVARGAGPAPLVPPPCPDNLTPRGRFRPRGLPLAALADERGRADGAASARSVAASIRRAAGCSPGGSDKGSFPADGCVTRSPALPHSRVQSCLRGERDTPQPSATLRPVLDPDQAQTVRAYTRSEIERRESAASAAISGNGVLSTIMEDLKESDDDVAMAELGDGSAGVLRVRHDGVTVYRWMDDNTLERLYLGKLEGGALIQKDRLLVDVGAALPAVRLQIEHDRLPGGSATLDLVSIGDEGVRLAIRDALLKLVS